MSVLRLSVLWVFFYEIDISVLPGYVRVSVLERCPSSGMSALRGFTVCTKICPIFPNSDKIAIFLTLGQDWIRTIWLVQQQNTAEQMNRIFSFHRPKAVLFCTALISSCNRTESKTITEEIQTSKFKAKKSNEPVGRVLIFALNLRVWIFSVIVRKAVAITN